MAEFKKSNISAAQQKEINNHLSFINHISLESIKYGYRTIVGGGYAVDGAIGAITRPHNDLDIQLYGKEVMNKVLLNSRILAGEYEKFTVEDAGDDYFYHKYFVNVIGAEIYYLRVATNPFTDTKIVITSDGKYSEEQDFDAKIVILNGIRFEVQSPVIELADKLYKRDYRGERRLSKHDQDIHNLRLITDSYEVNNQLDKIKKQNTPSL